MCDCVDYWLLISGFPARVLCRVQDLQRGLCRGCDVFFAEDVGCVPVSRDAVLFGECGFEVPSGLLECLDLCGVVGGGVALYAFREGECLQEGEEGFCAPLRVVEEIEQVDGAVPSGVGDAGGHGYDGSCGGHEHPCEGVRGVCVSVQEFAVGAFQEVVAPQVECDAAQGEGAGDGGEQGDEGPVSPLCSFYGAGCRCEESVFECGVFGCVVAHEAGAARFPVAEAEAVVDVVGGALVGGAEQEDASGALAEVLHLVVHERRADAFASVFGVGVDMSEDADALLFGGHDVADDPVVDASDVEAGLQQVALSGEGGVDVRSVVGWFVGEEGSDLLLEGVRGFYAEDVQGFAGGELLLAE